MIFLGAVDIAHQLNAMQGLIMDYTTAIITYVNEFIKYIMPLMIYVITFRIILTKS